MIIFRFGSSSFPPLSDDLTFLNFPSNLTNSTSLVNQKEEGKVTGSPRYTCNPLLKKNPVGFFIFKASFPSSLKIIAILMPLDWSYLPLEQPNVLQRDM